MENRFNLIDEPRIAVVDVGLVSLTDIFSQPELRALGGNPVEKSRSLNCYSPSPRQQRRRQMIATGSRWAGREWPIAACSTLLNGMTVFICMAKSRSYRCPLFRPRNVSHWEYYHRR